VFALNNAKLPFLPNLDLEVEKKLTELIEVGSANVEWLVVEMDNYCEKTANAASFLPANSISRTKTFTCIIVLAAGYCPNYQR
jgi:hypothetical protein